MGEDQKLLDNLVVALGELFSARVSDLGPDAANAICKLLEQQGGRVVFDVGLGAGPMRLTCLITREGVSVPVFEVEGGFDNFGFVEATASN